jgi:pyruvate dehydrogenase E2 component (dihydrolipoamide acetyltransferase)
LKKEGDAVAVGDVLAELESETALLELESACAGFLNKIFAPAGTSLHPGEALCEVGETAEVIAPAAEPTPEPAPEVAPEPVAETPAEEALPPAAEPVVAEQPTAPVTPILMPQAGQSMEEGTLVKWHVQPGDVISVGQVIFEIETDKATMEIESDHAGRLARIVVNVGETVPVKVPVAYLCDDDAAVDAYIATAANVPEQPTVSETAHAELPNAAEVAEEQASVDTPTITPEGRIKASPAARKMADERGINLAALGFGSGPGGRILSTDIPLAQPGIVATPADAGDDFPLAKRAVSAVGAPTRKKMSEMRKAIAKALTFSKQNVPHFYLTATIDASKLESFYRQAKAQFKCSVNDLIILAVGRTLHEFPEFRTRLEGEELVEYPTANVGMAVGLEKGLVVPVIMGVDRMDLQTLAGETRKTVEAARSGSIRNMGQGVFTISNMGMLGIESFTAIINPPEAGILAVGAMRPSIIASNEGFKMGKVMTVNLSCDHRVVDGMVGAKFMARLKQLLENPELLDA